MRRHRHGTGGDGSTRGDNTWNYWSKPAPLPARKTGGGGRGGTGELTTRALFTRFSGVVCFTLVAGLRMLEPHGSGVPLSVPLSRVRAPTWARPKASVLQQLHVILYHANALNREELNEGDQ